MRITSWRCLSVLLLSVSIALAGCQGTPPPAEQKATAKPGGTTAGAPTAVKNEAASPAAGKTEPTAAPKAAAKPGAVPTSLPKASQDYLAQLKMDASALSGLDDELKIPEEWVEAAKKEGNLSILHTIDPPQALVLFKPFQERYPFIKIDYNRGAQEEKMKALVAAESNRPTTDIIIGVGGIFFMMQEAGLLSDLTVLPTWQNVPEGFKDDHGFWAGIHIRHWAMAYNTDKVKQQDLPKTWDDLLTNPIWRNGNLAIGNRAELWALPLWRAKGEAWTRNYFTKVFTEVKPQLRKEGMNAILDLLSAGEFYATIPSAEYRTYQKTLESGNVRFWTPEPIPLASSEMVIMKKTANPYAARIFANWLLSKEGQMAQYVSDFAPPVHKDMRDRAWLPFADIIEGKTTALRIPEDAETLLPTVSEFWDGLWTKGTGGR